MDRWARLKVVASVVTLLVLPLIFGLGFGWFGLNPKMAERLNPPATYAHELLSSSPDGRLVVEIAAPPGGLPPAASVSILWSRMNETLSKNSITFQLETYSPPSSRSFSTDDLFSIEDQVRQTWPQLGTMSLFYLFIDGSYSGGAQVIGLTYAASSIAVFSSALGSGGPTASPGLVSTVLVHEFGHELGLVGLVGNAPNQDPNHPGHSNDPNDVMYWQVETTAIVGGLFGQSPPNQFDAADLADLQTVRSTLIPLEILPWVVLITFLLIAVIVAFAFRRGRRRREHVGPARAQNPIEVR